MLLFNSKKTKNSPEFPRTSIWALSMFPIYIWLISLVHFTMVKHLYYKYKTLLWSTRYTLHRILFFPQLQFTNTINHIQYSTFSLYAHSVCVTLEWVRRRIQSLRSLEAPQVMCWRMFHIWLITFLIFQYVFHLLKLASSSTFSINSIILVFRRHILILCRTILLTQLSSKFHIFLTFCFACLSDINLNILATSQAVFRAHRWQCSAEG